MIKVKLTKLESNHNNLRTNVVEGEIKKLPKEGDDGLILLGEGLEFGTRIVRTTAIKQVLNISDNVLEFKTLNSHYKLEVIIEEVKNET